MAAWMIVAAAVVIAVFKPAVVQLLLGLIVGPVEVVVARPVVFVASFMSPQDVAARIFSFPDQSRTRPPCSSSQTSFFLETHLKAKNGQSSWKRCKSPWICSLMWSNLLESPELQKKR